ncbi:MAG: hypothetical protein K0R50_3680 [Eubacterium sp.]|nr:hypothetical protein [Eubacterium sp.]
MLEFLRSWIINIVTISIILILFEIIVPSGKIKKIITLVSGFVLLIAVVNPFLALKNKGFELSETAMSDSFYIDKKEIENSSKLLEDTQMKQISSVYKRKLTARIEEETGKIEGVTGAKAMVEINEDFTSDRFGEITKVTVELKKGKDDKGTARIEPVISVKKIDITAPFINKEGKSKNDNLKDNNSKDNNSNDSKDKLKIADPEDKRLTELVKQSLNKSLEISRDSIEVTIT